jgi:CheY-like chemotaxis protein
VYGIVGRARGHIEMDSEEGRGTTFRIYLPVLADAPAAEEIRAPVVTGPQGSGETILLVEDEHAVRAVARRILATGGYQVIEAADGREALQVIASAETEVDLVLTDIVMPGMSGLDLDEAIRRLRPGTTTLFMTAYSEAVAFPDAVRGSLVVQKPFDSDTLLSTIHQVLSTATAA